MHAWLKSVDFKPIFRLLDAYIATGLAEKNVK